MRAPPESFKPMIGAPTFIARSITLQIFAAYASESEPPKTVKSWLKTNTSLPSTVPCPVTTPSPRYCSRPFVVETDPLVTKASSSTNESASSSRSNRSRAVSFPHACWRSTRTAPPPCIACCRICSRRAIRSAFVDTPRLLQIRSFVFAQRRPGLAIIGSALRRERLVLGSGAHWTPNSRRESPCLQRVNVVLHVHCDMDDGASEHVGCPQNGAQVGQCVDNLSARAREARGSIPPPPARHRGRRAVLLFSEVSP